MALSIQHQRTRHRDRGLATGSGIPTGDNQQLWKRLTDGSVDLFLIDPPNADVDSYHQFAELAAAKLKDGGLCAVYSGQFYLPDVMATLCNTLTYYWTVAFVLTGSNPRVNERRVTNGWKPILIYAKGAPRHDWIVDCLHGGHKAIERHQ